MVDPEHETPASPGAAQAPVPEPPPVPPEDDGDASPAEAEAAVAPDAETAPVDPGADPAADPVAADPVAAEPVAADPVVADPAADPVAADPAADSAPNSGPIARPTVQSRPGRTRAQTRPGGGGRLWAAAEARRAKTTDSDEDAADEAVHEAEEAVLADLTKLAAERDDYLDQLRRTKADFENYRKRVIRQQTEHLERAAEALAEKLLPVLDTFDAALAHGQGFEQVHAALMSTLEKEGLERIAPVGKPFDPNESDAVAHEEGDDGPVVTEVLRPGYRWKGRVLRPAMVRVRG